MFGYYDFDDVLTVTDSQTSYAYTTTLSSASGEGLKVDSDNLIIVPPADAVRVAVHVVWSATNTAPGFASASIGLSLLDKAGGLTSHTDDSDWADPGEGNSGSGAFDVEWTLDAGADWPVNLDTIGSSPSASDAGARIRKLLSVNGAGGNTATGIITATVTVTEIELDDGTIYTPAAGGAAMITTDWGASWAEQGVIAPGDRLLGDLHVPWEDNTDEAIVYYGAVDKSGNFAYSAQAHRE